MTLRPQTNDVLDTTPVPQGSEPTFFLETSRFGRVEVCEDRRFGFPGGLPGFPGPREMAVFPNPGGGIFEWLHSVTEPDLGFPVLAPDAELWSLIQAPVSKACESQGWESEDAFEVRLIVTIPAGEPSRATLNLRAPIVLNATHGQGAQPILTDDAIPLRMPLFPDRAKRGR